MSSKTLNKMAAALVGVAIALGAAPATSVFVGSAEASSSPTFSRFDTHLIQLINKARVNRGLRPLRVAAGTTDIAHSWSCHMAAVRAMSHNSNLAHELATHGSNRWTSYDENVGFVTRHQGASRLFHSYMNSPMHRANILDSSARYIGTWTKRGGGYRFNTIDFVGSRTSAYKTSYGAMRTTC